MKEAKTTPTKCIFLDVAGFTNDRSVEAQVDIVGTLNRLVKESLEHHNITRPKRILLPTGDGLCIVLLDVKDPHDVHIRIALSVLGSLEKHNSASDKEIRASRKFQVRIGISQNDDTLVTDINGRRNIAGAGINTAQRVMDKADGSQILVSQTVYDHLRDREKYMESFQEFTTTTKHGKKVNVYHLLAYTAHGYNLETPSAFRGEEKSSKLPRLVAYYLAHAMVNRDTMLERKEWTDEYGGVILLYFKADDSVRMHVATEFREPVIMTHGAESNTPFTQQYDFYSNIEMFTKSLLHSLIIKEYLSKYGICFALSGVTTRDYRYVSSRGQEKLKDEWPEIWDEFKLDEYV